MPVCQVDDQGFAEEISEGLVLVDFWAPWCPPCAVMGPYLDEIADERDDVKIVKVDTNRFRESAASLGVRSLPTLVLFKDGEEVERVVGAQSKQRINELIDEGK